MSSEPLLPVYLLTGSDRPKHLRALRRLRARFGPEAVEQHSADEASGADAVAACNALGLFGAEGGGRLVIVEGVDRWRKGDIDAVADYLRNPVEGAVLALVVDGAPRGSALNDLCAKHGQVLHYDVPRSNQLYKWVQAELKRLEISADADAARALVELVGEDTVALAGEIEKIAAWSGGEPRCSRKKACAHARSRAV
jgi:DNA polymerase III delta subunit